jgi:hypothetical protein
MPVKEREVSKKNWKGFAFAAAALAVAGFGLMVNLPSTEAVANYAPVGDIVVCDGSKDHLLQSANGPFIDVHTTGHLTAVAGDSFATSDGRAGTYLGVQDVFSSGDISGLGNVTFRSDDRPAGKSSIVANQAGRLFPATQTMRFNFTTTIDGKSYRSATPAVVSNSSVSAFPPARGTVYVLTNAVNLVDGNGKVAYNLQPGKAFTIDSAK